MEDCLPEGGWPGVSKADASSIKATLGLSAGPADTESGSGSLGLDSLVE